MQHDGHCHASHLRHRCEPESRLARLCWCSLRRCVGDVLCAAMNLCHSDAEVVVLQWKHAVACDACLFFPNSSQNEGRNELWYVG